jgi:tetratricopeptide (TPR) repeat protein
MGRDDERAARRPDDWEPEVWIDEGSVREVASEAVHRGEREARPAPTEDRIRKAPKDVEAELVKAVGPDRTGRTQTRLMEAAKAYERERYQDALRIVRPLADQAPAAASVRELHGLTLYRLGRWRDAVKELEAFRSLTGSADQHPVLADCYRALRRYAEVDELWDELREASPGAEIVTEGRIVVAGAYADQGRLRDAIRLLEQGPVAVTKPRLHHLRLWYALAGLFERAGDVTRARELFLRIANHDDGFADVVQRLRSLS